MPLEDSRLCHAADLAFDGLDPHDEGRREALLSLGNGKLTQRGAACWTRTGEVHYPGTYRAACYNRLGDVIQGEEVSNESLVNLPDGMLLTFRVEGDADWFSLADAEVLDYRHALDLDRGIACRSLRLRDRLGRRIRLRERRLVSMAQPDLAAVRLEVEPEGWSGRIEIRSAIDGGIANDRVPRFGRFDRQHLEAIAGELAEPGLLLRARTRCSGIAIAVAARTLLVEGRVEARQAGPEVAAIAEQFRCAVAPGQPARIEKVVAIRTSQDEGDPAGEALALLRQAPGFAALEEAHAAAWAPLMARLGITAERPELVTAMRYRAFQLLQTASPHSVGLDAGFPARGWQEAYRGQIFWDETFVLPFFNSRFPEVARALLLYRCRRLEDARQEAREHGYRGAMFPWRSASNGREQTPRFQYNMLSGRWMEDHTRLQRHVGAVIACNLWRHLMVTGDRDFLAAHGARIFLEIARFWGSIARHDPVSDRYDIHGVCGPDEYHVAWPGAAEPGITNSSFTNVMAAWVLARAPEVLEMLPGGRREALREEMGLEDAELALWDRISRRLRLAFGEDGVLLPFEGFDRLKPLDIGALRREHPGERLDWVLESLGESTNDYQLLKQADTMMLPFLLPHGELEEIMDRLGYPMTPELLRRTAAHDLARTSHESSLSHIAFAGALARLDPETSWSLFEGMLKPEHDPSSASSVAEGAHMGALGGAIDVLQRHYLGFSPRREAILLHPAPPAALGRVLMDVACHFGRFRLEWTGRVLILGADSGNAASVRVEHAAGTEMLSPGGALRLEPGGR
ncbi:glycoside hydrolase family 65 protein [Roseomonas marmotae]|uniref:Glycoside hydrolase family 65 protein n=1 Tax=Roseomonas marmotae TaxID=2768161 RepID=A0ABS3K853_9PROT|nr:glycoside hydrolase family 65 protein [Roseomonas marmotae]MBO1073618.1 glycoside hydrolase family 65 protein [Roseomonas marmotae]MBO1073648.1 glycoside hydrolase family 65 protein [Roseomonas marmotae]QTI80202.1 glycoside hydrolase family 65 protein [Roseomonas marmotae]